MQCFIGFFCLRISFSDPEIRYGLLPEITVFPLYVHGQVVIIERTVEFIFFNVRIGKVAQCSRNHRLVMLGIGHFKRLPEILLTFIILLKLQVNNPDII